MDNFFNKKFCDRCHKSLSNGFSMSRFNTDTLCMECIAEERQHPDYPKAVDAELEQIKNGNRNYEGIGYPRKNGRLK